MTQIKFKATKKKHSSDWTFIENSGDLKFDQDKHPLDGISVYLKNGERVFLDCNFKTKVFTVHFDEKTHREFHKKYGIKNNTEEHLLEFLK